MPCKPKNDGCLGFILLKLMDQTLLGKWIWRIGEDSDGHAGSHGKI